MLEGRLEDRPLVRGPLMHDDIVIETCTLYYITKRELSGNERQNDYTRDWDMSQEFGPTLWIWKLAKCYATFDS